MTNDSPLRERWQPVRGGLINLFKYEDQIFRYENGRLLLRGDNGSGKSRVLALQLPFLLDGEISPYRVEPDRDPAKRMEWHLLMDRHERRTGYTWIEFGRRDEEGVEHYLTLGCGLDARKGGGAPDRWFFITTRRIGHDFALLRNRVPLGRRQLAAAFDEADEGRIFVRAGEYRIAVDDALFKLGGRYQPLLDLLIQLRQPQLMRNMKEDVLSNALSEALPPVPDPLINEVAESFQGLDTDRQHTEDHRQMFDTVESFREGYRQYLSVAVRRLCEVVRIGHSRYEHATKDLRRIDAEIEDNAGKLAGARSDRERVRSELARLEAEIQTLRDSPEMRSKRELDQAVRRADECEKDWGAARSEWEHADKELERVRGETAERVKRSEALRGAVARGYEQLCERHKPVASDEAELLDWKTEEMGAARGRVDELLESRQRGVVHLRRRNQEIAEHRAIHDRERAQAETHRGLVADAGDTVNRLGAELDEAMEEFGNATGDWERSLTILHAEAFPRGTDWRGEAARWLEEREGIDPFKRCLDEAREQVRQELSEERSGIVGERGLATTERLPLAEELELLRDGRQPEPVARPGRGPRPDDRPGAPFWRMFEFREEVPEAEHGAWEAALESAGLLDAWVFPDGRFDGAGEQDDFLGIGTDPELDHRHSLAAVLRSVDGGEELDAMLRRIGNHRDAARCWLSRDGDWANGPHHGRGSKEAGEFLGHRAREAARMRRIGELERLLAEIDGRIAELDRLLVDLDGRILRLADEVRSAPTLESANQCLVRLEQARMTLQERKTRLVEAEDRVVETDRALTGSIALRDGDAKDLGLAAWAEPEALDEFAKALDAFKDAAGAFWPEWRRLIDADAELDAAREREKRAKESEGRASDLHAGKKELAARVRAAADTLLASVGVTVEELMDRLRLAEERAGTAKEALSLVEGAIRDGEIAEAGLAEKRSAALEKRESEEAVRNDAVGRLDVFVAERLIAEVDPDAEVGRAALSAKAAVELSRRLEQQLKGHESGDERWHLLQSEITASFHELSDQLGRHGLVPHLRTIDESSVSVITCEFQGMARSVGELSDVLRDELASRERIFQEREREVIENHLIGEAAVELQKRIRDGEDWVARVNEELSEVSTSSGIRLRFVWELGDGELGEVRRLFLKTSATWTLAERDRIGAFLQQRIQTAREADDTVAWREHLGRALDYRSWHHFGIQLRREGDSAWKRLTKRTFGTGSGGEKAMTLTVPQFAAAAAHYHSAHPHAPRLILLDEAFVAIDAPTRARLMGLLETFDLDYVMTSEREWGVYPTVSALAIYQLASRPGHDAVAVTRWVWNGREKVRDASGVEESSTRPAEGDE